MENKINIAELLKDCPKGMELDCISYNGIVCFEEINNSIFPIEISVKYDDKIYHHSLTEYGQIYRTPYSNCVIFPKDKNTWEGFVPPCKFMDGDVVAQDTSNGTQLFINKEDIGNGYAYCYMMLDDDGKAYFGVRNFHVERLATEEEKEKLFKEIEKNGYRWNAETKTLERLPKFKDGDIVFYNNTIAIFKNWGDETLFRSYVNINLYHDSLIIRNAPLFGKGIRREIRLATEEEKEKLFKAIENNGYKWNVETKTLEKLIEPKFKVGDKIKLKNSPSNLISTVTKINDDGSICVNYYTWVIKYELQYKYELVLDKFDISTLQPYISKVLVRDDEDCIWQPSVWGLYDKGHRFPYITTGNRYRYCIPYESNEHLIGTTDDCDNFYKTWEDLL